MTDRPRWVNPKKDPEGYRAYMRAYQRARGKAVSADLADRRVDRSVAAFDPQRDDKPVYRSPFAQILGEPPIGRSALDQRREANARER